MIRKKDVDGASEPGGSGRISARRPGARGFRRSAVDPSWSWTILSAIVGTLCKVDLADCQWEHPVVNGAHHGCNFVGSDL